MSAATKAMVAHNATLPTAATAMSSCRLNHMDFAVTFAAASLFSVVVRCDVDVPLQRAMLPQNFPVLENIIGDKRNCMTVRFPLGF